MREEIKKSILENRVVAIVRGLEPEKCMRLAEALCEGGIRLMELPYDQSDRSSWAETAKTVERLSTEFEGRMVFGAGTVTCIELVELTCTHGGRFIVAPNTNVSVIRRAAELDMVSVPGAMTPTEILSAHEAGADIVKLFPASVLGIPYLKAIRAPISHVDILAAGGIDKGNAADFLRAGASCLGVGGALANKSAIESGDFAAITEAARALLAAIKGI